MIRIIIPAYNEEKNIELTIKNIATNLKSQSYKFYIVNDGSEDITQKIVQKMQKKYPIILINNVYNKGVADFFRTDLTAVYKDSKINDVIFIMEADNTSDPSLLPEMIKRIKKGSDIVVASRYIHGGLYKNFPLKRLILSKIINVCLRFLFPSANVTDYTIVYRAYKPAILKKAFNIYKDTLITTKYFVVNAEILIKIIALTNKIEEVPFVYDYNKKKGTSGFHIRKNIMQYLIFITKAKLVK